MPPTTSSDPIRLVIQRGEQSLLDFPSNLLYDFPSGIELGEMYSRRGCPVSEEARDIEGFLISRLAEREGVSVEEIRGSIATIGGIDSLAGVELILDAEERYGVSIPDDAVSSAICRSVSELARLIRAQVAG
jgi:acyl carrier protein